MCGELVAILTIVKIEYQFFTSEKIRTSSFIDKTNTHTVSLRWKNKNVKFEHRFYTPKIIEIQVRIQRGDRGSGPPPGKSQVIWVSKGNKQLDPPPLEKVGPPPLENVGPPLEPWKMIDFFEIDHIDFCKISWGLKKKTKKKRRSFFWQTDLPPPPPPWRKFMDPRMKLTILFWYQFFTRCVKFVVQHRSLFSW